MKKLFCLLIGLVGLAILAALSGPALVLDRPDKCDVIVVLGGDRDDIRYHRAVELLREGYAPQILLDASEGGKWYGHTDADYAAEFVSRLEGDLKGRVSVCPYFANSTVAETIDVARCM